MPNRYYSMFQNDRQATVDIFGDITSWPWLESDVSNYNLSKAIEGLDVDEIIVNINSYGGEVAEGIAIYNMLKNHTAKVTTHCVGMACSMASVIFMAGDERIMDDASLLMIHNAWTRASGNAYELRRQADDLEMVNSLSVKAYMNRVNISQEELQQLMDDESFIKPEDALTMGFATALNKDDEDGYSQSAKNRIFAMLTKPPTATSAGGTITAGTFSAGALDVDKIVVNMASMPALTLASDAKEVARIVKQKEPENKSFQIWEGFFNAFKEDKHD